MKKSWKNPNIIREKFHNLCQNIYPCFMPLKKLTHFLNKYFREPMYQVFSTSQMAAMLLFFVQSKLQSTDDTVGLVKALHNFQ